MRGKESDELIRVKKVLGEYRLMGAKMALLEKKSRGDNLIVQPSVTASNSIEEDDHDVLEVLKSAQFTDSQEKVIEVLKKHLSEKQLRYATYKRVSKLLEHVDALSDEDQEILDGFKRTLDSHAQDEYVHLTTVEKIAYIRSFEIEDSRRKLVSLKARKEAIDDALKTLQSYYPDEYYVLYERFVNRRRQTDVQADFIELRGYPLTLSEHDQLRRHGVELFCELCSIVEI